MALVVVYLVVAIAIVVIAWRVADDRGRRPGVWGGLAFLFGIFALLVLILLPSKAEERQAARSTPQPAWTTSTSSSGSIACASRVH